MKRGEGERQGWTSMHDTRHVVATLSWDRRARASCSVFFFWCGGDFSSSFPLAEVFQVCVPSRTARHHARSTLSAHGWRGGLVMGTARTSFLHPETQNELFNFPLATATATATARLPSLTREWFCLVKEGCFSRYLIQIFHASEFQALVVGRLHVPGCHLGSLPVVEGVEELRAQEVRVFPSL